MTRTMTTLALTMTLVFLTGCGGSESDTHDKVMRDTIDMMKEMTTLMSKITDEASAEANAPKLAELSKKFEALQERQEAVGDPNEEQEAALKTKYEAEMQEVVEPFMKEMLRIAMNPALAKHLEEAMPSME
jgi:Skp family chaperone for outer membrane proteins